MKTVTDIFDVVDEQDRVIAQCPRAEVHARGLLHRATHIWIWNAQGQFLLQKRSAHKDRFPNTWTSSVSGHVDSGENYLQAAQREIQEEAGIHEPVELQEIAYIHPCAETEQEFVRLYKITHEGPFLAHPQEITELRWVSPAEMEDLLVKTPGDFSPSLVYLWRLYGSTAQK